MKINSNIAMALFAIVLALNSVNGMIIKKNLEGRPHLHRSNESKRLERRLMDEIKKEKDKNKMLKDLLKKQENLSQELDKKMLDTTNGQSDKADKVVESPNKQAKKSDDKSSDSKTRKLTQATNSLQKTDSKPEKMDNNSKGGNDQNDRKLKQTNKSLENSKSIVNNSKQNDKSTISSKLKNNEGGNKLKHDSDARKLNDATIRKRLQSTPTLNANSTRKALRKTVVQKISTPSQKFKPVLPAKLAQKSTRQSTKRQLKAAPAATPKKRQVKKLALRGHQDIISKPLAKKVAINQVNSKHNMRQHSTNGSIRGNKRNLNQSKPSSSNRLAVQKQDKNSRVVASKHLKKIISKPVAAKRQLSHTDNNKVAQQKRAIANLANKNKQPVRWTKHSRKLVGKSDKKHKSHNRILDEAEGADDYPVKLMNASISYPILGMVNLGSGEYDLHIS